MMDEIRFDLNEPEPCPVCKGSGNETVEVQRKTYVATFTVPCVACAGTGDKKGDES